MAFETVDEVEKHVRHKMDGSLAALKNDFSSLQSGRVTPALLDRIMVDYYGNPTPISQVGSISTPDAQTLAINPWEKKLIKEIERSLQSANIGLNVSNDGNLIRAIMPPLTQERRKEQVKQVKKMGEESKVAVRNIRREGNDALKKLEKGKQISKDEEKAGHDHIQNITNQYVKSVGDMVANKEKEMMTL